MLRGSPSAVADFQGASRLQLIKLKLKYCKVYLQLLKKCLRHASL